MAVSEANTSARAACVVSPGARRISSPVSTITTQPPRTGAISPVAIDSVVAPIRASSPVCVNSDAHAIGGGGDAYPFTASWRASGSGTNVDAVGRAPQ